jgi:ATP-dependent protease ClpP protease subunit
MLYLDLFGTIGDEIDGFTDVMVAEAIDGLREPLTVRINSPGGFAYDGIAIYNILAPHRPHVEVIGLAASAASVVAMAGQTIHVATGCQLMIHDAWSLTMGNELDHRKQADHLGKLSGSIASIYAKRSGKPVAEFRKLMLAETWLTGADAVELGLADTHGDNRTPKAKADPAAAKRREAAFMRMRVNRLLEAN